MVELRNYQMDLIGDIRAKLKEGYETVLAVASTGAGKTVMFSFMTHGAQARNNAVLALAHRKEIIRQISMSFAKFHIRHKVFASKKLLNTIYCDQFKAFGKVFVDTESTVMVGSVQTVIGRLGEIDIAVAKTGGNTIISIFDEGHHLVDGTQHATIFEYCKKRFNMRSTIWTATPCRLDGKGLGKGHGGFADCMVEAPPMSWLIDNGFLSTYRIFTAQERIDLSGIKKVGGEWVATQCEQLMNKAHITKGAFESYTEHAKGLKAVCFCASIKHSKDVAQEFTRLGVPARHIDGCSTDEDRDAAIMDFASGKVLVLTNVNLVSEGFDLSAIAQKDVTIDCLIDLSPTASLVTYMQRCGRALRPYLGKIAILLDLSGNFFTHGSPSKKREWSLEGTKKQSRSSSIPDEPMIVCKRCTCAYDPAPMCPNCGFINPVKHRKVMEKNGKIIEVTPELEDAINNKKERKKEVGKARSLADLKRIEAQRGYKKGWAEYVFKSRGGRV